MFTFVYNIFRRQLVQELLTWKSMSLFAFLIRSTNGWIALVSKSPVPYPWTAITSSASHVSQVSWTDSLSQLSPPVVTRIWNNALYELHFPEKIQGYSPQNLSLALSLLFPLCRIATMCGLGYKPPLYQSWLHFAPRKRKYIVRVLSRVCWVKCAHGRGRAVFLHQIVAEVGFLEGISNVSVSREHSSRVPQALPS